MAKTKTITCPNCKSIYFVDEDCTEYTCLSCNAIILGKPLKIYRPKSSMTCTSEKYIKRENLGNILLFCDKCRDNKICIMAGVRS